MRYLSPKGHWDRKHSERDEPLFAGSTSAVTHPARKSAVRAPCQKETLDMRCFWAICERYLPKGKLLRLVEIGCAPGALLLLYHRRFGYDPWGIDYSRPGVIKARELLKASGFGPDRIVEADLFSPKIAKEFDKFFDVVTSHGFLEHFDQPTDVVARCVTLLRPGGFLVAQIPVLRGFNRLRYARIFASRPELLRMHNLAIMRLPAFRRLFKDPRLGLQTLFTGYFGGINLRGLFPRWLPDIASAADRVLLLLFGDRGFGVPFFSPHLIYIGRRVR